MRIVEMKFVELKDLPPDIRVKLGLARGSEKRAATQTDVYEFQRYLMQKKAQPKTTQHQG